MPAKKRRARRARTIPGVEVHYEPDTLHPSNSRIMMQIDLTTPPGDVAEAYRQKRNEIVGNRRVRRLSPKRTTLFSFCMTYGGEGRWDGCRKAWNRRHRKWRYSETWRFKGEALLARRRLLYPDYLPEAVSVDLRFPFERRKAGDHERSR